eukprot:UN03647
MQADGSAPIEKRRGYKHVVDAIIRTYREEGFLTLYRGVGPTIVRGMVVSMTQLATYDQAKSVLLNLNIIKEEGVRSHLSASLISGSIYCAT